VGRIPRVRDVAGGEHVRNRGPKLLVDENAVIDLEAGVAGQVGARRDADPHDGEVAVDRAGAGRAHARDHAVAFERLHALAEQQLDAALRMHIAIEAADLGAEDPLVRKLERVDHRDVEAALPGGGSELAADPARADDDYPAAGVEALA